MTGANDTNTKLVKADPTKGVRVDAAIIAKRFRDEIKEKVANLKASGIRESSKVTVGFPMPRVSVLTA